MKYLFFFFVFLSIQFALSQEIPSYTNLLNYESSINLQQISYEKHRGFYFDPVIELNGNRGNFKTSFSIEMPSNLANFRFLTLNYNSAQSANYGLGVGFGWHLPFITYESSATTRVKYTFHGKKASGSLVETKEVLSKLKDSLVLNLKTLRPNVDLVGMNSYRPLVDRSFDLFVKMTTTDGIYWVIVKLNGNRWFLNKEGLPVGMINQLNNHITFTWQDNVLIKLEDGHKNWHMDIKYLNKFNEKTSYHRQLFSLPKGIESIKTWNQQKLVRHLKFVYDDEYLLTAKYKSALMPLFQGKYNGYAAKIVGEQTNNYLVHDDKLPVFIDSSETATAQIIDPTSHIYKMFVDINNDGIEDKITFDYTAIFNQIESFYKGIDFADYVDEGNRTLQLKKSKMDKINPILEQLPVIDLKVSIKDSDTQIRFLEDTKLLKVLQQIRLLNFFLKKKILKKDGYTIKYWEIKTFANGVNFVDLNSDGKKDIVSCPGSQEFANKKFEIQSSPFIVNGKNVKRSVSPLYLQAITFAYPENSIDTNKFVNPFQVAGDIATVFIQKADFEFLDALKASTQGETFSSASILESYNWKPRADLKVRCHQHSLFVDYNKDGFVDVISGKDIYFNNGGHGFVKDDFSNKAQNIFEKGDQQLDVELNDFSFADLNGNGKLEIYQAKKIKTLRKKSTTQIIKAGVTQKHIRSSGRKLLAQLLSPFGGHIKIDYQNQEGRFIVKSLETVDEKAEVIKRFDYIGKAFDPITHVFTGYGQIAMKVSYPADETQRIIEHTIERGFYTEQNVRDYVLGTKGEISGLLQVEVTSQNQADATNFPDKKELRNHWTLLELSGKRVHPFVHIAQNNVLQYEIEDNDNKYMITKSKKTTKSFDNWQLAGPSQKIFPLTINTHIQGHGLYSSYHDQMLDGAKMINVGHDYLDNFYMRVLNYKKEVGRDGKLLSPILKARMRDDHGLARKICKGEKCVRIAYDHLGRKIKIKSDFDELHRQNVSYYEGLPLASTYTSKAGSYSYSYDSNLFNLNKIHRDGQILFEYDFYDDGILKQIKNNKAIIYHLTPFTSEVATPEVQEGQNADTYLIYKKDFNLLTSGADLTITVDGLGNIVNQAQTLNGSLRFKGQKTYLGQKLISKTYPSVDSKSDAIYLTYNYDGLGRLLKKRQADLLEYSFEFSNGSSKQTLNGDLVLGNSKHSLVGNLIWHGTGDEWFDLEVRENNQVNKIKNLDLSWQRDKLGNVISFLDSGVNQTRSVNGSGTHIEKEGIHLFRRKDGALQSTRRGSGLSREYPNMLEQHVLYKQAMPISFSYTHKDLDINWKEVRSYDIYNRALTHNFLNYDFSLSYNDYGQTLSRQVTKDDQLFTSTEYVYKDGALSAIVDMIESIDYDKWGNITEIKWINGLHIKRQYNDTINALDTIKVSSPNGVELYHEIIARNKYQQISGRRTKSISYEDEILESFKYNGLMLNSPKSNKHAIGDRDIDGRVKSVDNLQISWSDANPILIKGQQRELEQEQEQEYNFYYTATGKLKVACQTGNKVGDVGCYYQIDDDTFYFKDIIVQIIKLNNLPVAVKIDKMTFPIVTDHLGSVKAIFSMDGQVLLVARHYDEWGNEVKTFNPQHIDLARQIDELVVWKFAKLIRPPLIDTKLYWSKSRVYSPSLGQWLSKDPVLMWNPDLLLDRPGNWYGVRYCNNDPVNFVDPSGKSTSRWNVISRHEINSALATVGKVWGSAAALAITPFIAIGLIQSAPIAYNATPYISSLLVTHGPNVLSNMENYIKAGDFFNGMMPTAPSNYVESLGFLTKEFYDAFDSSIDIMYTSMQYGENGWNAIQYTPNKAKNFHTTGGD